MKEPVNDNDEFRAYVGACTDALTTQTERGWPEMLLLPEPKTDTERAALKAWTAEMKRQLGVPLIRAIHCGSEGRATEG